MPVDEDPRIFEAVVVWYVYLRLGFTCRGMDCSMLHTAVSEVVDVVMKVHLRLGFICRRMDESLLHLQFRGEIAMSPCSSAWPRCSWKLEAHCLCGRVATVPA